MNPRTGFEDSLAELRRLDIDPESIIRIRARCVRALEAQHRGRLSLLPRPARWRNRLELAAAFGLCIVYLAAAVASGLSLLR